MDTLASFAKWVLFGSIFGILGASALIYLLLKLLERKIHRLPEPAFIVLPLAIIALLVLPSIPRYEFERTALSEVSGKAWIRVVNQTRWGDFTEPLTLIWTPVGSIYAVMPENPLEGAGFREVLMRYGKKTTVTLADPDCTDNSILRSAPDSSGVFRYETPNAEPMTPADITLYCKSDWSKERAALIAEMKRRTNAEKDIAR